MTEDRLKEESLKKHSVLFSMVLKEMVEIMLSKPLLESSEFIKYIDKHYQIDWYNLENALYGLKYVKEVI